MIAYEIVILASWAAFLLVWAVSALDVKRDVRGGYASLWSSGWLIRMVVATLLLAFVFRRGRGHSIFSGRMSLFTPAPALAWTAAALTAIGIAFAIWARLILGRNWSPSPAVKEQHELVRSGPYSYVRHPIYTGLLLSAFGTALTGTVFGAIVFVAAAAVFLSRIPREERIMLELFPETYPAYRARTRRLVPFVW